MLGFVLRALAAGAALFVLQGLAAGLTTVLFGPLGLTMPPGALGWIALSNLVTAAALLWMAQRSRLSGLRLAGVLAVVLFGVATFNGMIEALFFHVFGAREFARHVLAGALAAAAFSLVVVALIGRMRRPSVRPAEASAGAATPAVWRLAVADLLYYACYIGAGTVIYPWVREFYLGRSLPPAPQVAAMQLFFRGPIFIALLLLLVRTTVGERSQKALLAGAVLSLVGGVAPLLIPNPYLPDVVRWAHFFEVGVSNLFYGAAATWLMTPPPRPVAALAGSSA